MQDFQECGDCNACCTWLHGDAYGSKFGSGKSCLFLNKKCTIYGVRPDFCKKFECGYTQKLFPQDWMRPDKSGALIMIQNWSKGQYLRIIETGKKMLDEAFLEIINFCKKYNTPYIMQYDGEWSIHGPEDFLREKKQNDHSSLHNL